MLPPPGLFKQYFNETLSLVSPFFPPSITSGDFPLPPHLSAPAPHPLPFQSCPALPCPASPRALSRPVLPSKFNQCCVCFFVFFYYIPNSGSVIYKLFIAVFFIRLFSFVSSSTTSTKISRICISKDFSIILIVITTQVSPTRFFSLFHSFRFLPFLNSPVKEKNHPS